MKAYSSLTKKTCKKAFSVIVTSSTE